MTTKRLIMSISVGTLLCVAVVKVKNVDIRGVVSALVDHFGEVPTVASDLARDVFAQTSVDPLRLVDGHTHPKAAGLRTTATNFVEKVAARAGTKLFVSGMSRSDQRKGLHGSRQWYWAKDTNVENRRSSPEPADIEYFCDVDYYVNMPDVLSKVVIPRILYTCVPEQASCPSTDDMALCFDEQGNLVTRVSGGGFYSHKLWDYGADSLLCVATWFGIPTKVVSYAVERKQVGPNRQLILLAPIRVFRGLVAVFASMLLQGQHIQRFDPVVKASDGTCFIRFNVMRKDGLYVTTSRPGSYASATIPAEADDAIATVARLGTTNLMLPTTTSWLDKQSRQAAAVMTEFHRLCTAVKTLTIFPVERAVRAYQYEPQIFDQEVRPKLEAFMSPLVHGAFAPVPNAAGERQCVEGRINSLKGAEPKPHAFRDRCIREFAELLMGDVILEPVCYETIADKQTNPAQKLSLKKAVLQGPKLIRIVKCFLKSEAYGDVKDPRNITTYNDLDKLSLAEYSAALSGYCKRFRWYGPGKTPLQIAERMVEICQGALFGVNISDFHRMDGCIKRALCEVDRVVYMKAFVHHRAVLNELLKRQIDNSGVLPCGTTFEQESTHGSGRSDTALVQTLRAAFTSYLAYRHTPTISGRVHSPREAMEALGIHTGDDGVDADLPVVSHEWASERVGLVLEAKFIPRGEPGVNFLARYYSPEVWTGSPHSMCDVRRQLSKFHTTVRLPFNVTPEQKAVEKCMAYSLTDGNTPVLGPFCQRMLMLSSHGPRTRLGVGHWWSRFTESEQFPNENVGGWMDVEFERQFPEFDRGLFEEWLASATSVKILLRAPLCAEPKRATASTAAVVVDGEVLEALEAASGPACEELHPVSSDGECNDAPERDARKTRARRPKPKSSYRDGVGKPQGCEPRGAGRKPLDRGSRHRKSNL